MGNVAALGDETVVKITSKGQVFLSKAIREKVGIAPGGSVGVRANDRGEVVLRSVSERGETPDERRARIRAALDAATGIIDIGMSTDEFMKELRGDWEP
jgi:antitoxin PrlF